MIPPGEIVQIGGPIRKDVSGYDVKSLLVGSEGTLGLVTAAWLRLIPAPELELPVIGLYRDADAGISAIERVLASGRRPRGDRVPRRRHAVVFGRRLSVRDPRGRRLHGHHRGRRVARGGTPRRRRVARGPGGGRGRGARARGAVRGRGAMALARRRAFAILAQRGGAFSEDIAVPLDRLREVASETLEIGERHGVPALSFGHAGDGNIHSTFLFSPDDPDEERRADAACHDLFELALRLGGTVTGEHGIGWLKRGQLAAAARPRRLRPAHAAEADLRPEEPAQPRQEALAGHRPSRAESLRYSALPRRTRTWARPSRRMLDPCTTPFAAAPARGSSPALTRAGARALPRDGHRPGAARRPDRRHRLDLDADDAVQPEPARARRARRRTASAPQAACRSGSTRSPSRTTSRRGRRACARR